MKNQRLNLYYAIILYWFHDLIILLIIACDSAFNNTKSHRCNYVDLLRILLINWYLIMVACSIARPETNNHNNIESAGLFHFPHRIGTRFPGFWKCHALSTR